METPLGKCAQSGHPSLFIWLYHCQHTGTTLIEWSAGTSDDPHEVSSEHLGPFDTVADIENRLLDVMESEFFAQL